MAVNPISSKKGFIKTVEAIIASLMLVTFIAFVIPTNFESSTQDQLGVLSKLQLEEGFRTCVINDNTTCVQTYIESKLPTDYLNKYRFMITTDNQAVPTDLPKTKVISENIFIATDKISIKSKIVRLYYWQTS